MVLQFAHTEIILPGMSCVDRLDQFGGLICIGGNMIELNQELIITQDQKYTFHQDQDSTKLLSSVTAHVECGMIGVCSMFPVRAVDHVQLILLIKIVVQVLISIFVELFCDRNLCIS